VKDATIGRSSPITTGRTDDAQHAPRTPCAARCRTNDRGLSQSRPTEIAGPRARATSADRQLWRALTGGCESHAVAVHLGRGGTDGLSKLLEECATDDFTYQPIGGSLTSVVPPDLHRHHWHTRLPTMNAFDRAIEALRSWEMHRGSGLLVVADGPIAVGTNVAMIAPLPVGHVDVTCRIVAVIDEPDRYGFAYGTLRVHPERGEEAFVVTREGSGARFDVDAISRPADPVSRLLPFVADRLQDRAVRRYLSTIKRLAEQQ
jgi:uncharacterized protein (UPF0548 family)